MWKKSRKKDFCKKYRKSATSIPFFGVIFGIIPFFLNQVLAKNIF